MNTANDDTISSIAKYITNAVEKHASDDHYVRKIILNGPIEIVTTKPVTICKTETTCVKNKIDFNKLKNTIKDGIDNEKSSDINLDNIVDIIKSSIAMIIDNKIIDEHDECECQCKKEEEPEELNAMKLAAKLNRIHSNWTYDDCVTAADTILKNYRITKK